MHEILKSANAENENRKLIQEIKKLKTRFEKLDEGYSSQSSTPARNPNLRDLEPSSTMSAVSLHYKCSELYDSYQKILETLTNRDKEIKTAKKRIQHLEAHASKIQKLLRDKDIIIHEICIKYLKLQNRRDNLVSLLQLPSRRCSPLALHSLSSQYWTMGNPAII